MVVYNWQIRIDELHSKLVIRHLQGKHNQKSHGSRGKSLKTGEITEVRYLGGGVNVVFTAKLGDEKVVIKPESGLSKEKLRNGIKPGGELGRERAAYLMDKHMGGITNVPETVIRDAPPRGGRSMVHRWVDGETLVTKWHDIPKNRVNDFAFYDSVIGNLDRHKGNVLIGKNNSVIGIDHGMAFPSRNNNIGNHVSMFTKGTGATLTDKHQKILDNLKKNKMQVTSSLKGHVPDSAIKAMYVRINYMSKNKKLFEFED